MRKILSFLIVAAFCLLFAVPPKAVSAESKGTFTYSGFDIDAFFEEFSVDFFNRSVHAADEVQDRVTERIASEFLALGYDPIKTSAPGGVLATGNATAPNPTPLADSALTGYYDEFTFDYGEDKLSSRNVIAVKKADPASSADEPRRSVIVGAHYDNVYNYELTSQYNTVPEVTLSNGAYDNASGMAVMLSVAHNLKDTSLPFDVVFVAFGAEELGMIGSQYYVKNMTETQKQNTLLMVNLDSICAGDYLYLFAADYRTGHEDYLREKAASLNVPLRKLPKNKKFMNDPFGLGVYAHMGYYSDNYFFMKAGIPTAFFLTMNWESKKKAGVVESDTHENIMHTSLDTYHKVKEYYPDTYLQYMQYTSAVVTESLAANGFMGAMVNSLANTPTHDFITNQRYITVGAFIAWLALAVFAVVWYYRLKKRSALKIQAYLEKAAVDVATPGAVFIKVEPGRHTYPPHSYRPKKGEEQFSVFGEVYELKEGEEPKPPKNDDDQDKPPPRTDKYDGLK